MPNKWNRLKAFQGFTLVELLIVIAILGILATVVLLVINPAEQFGRTRDAARQSASGQLIRAEQAYYTDHGGTYSPVGAAGAGNGWIDQLVTAGELKQVPTTIAYGIVKNNTVCAAAGSTTQESNYCYIADASSATDVVFYVTLESSSEQSKCAGAGTHPYFVWESKTGSQCLMCLNAAPTQSGGVCNAVQ